jgi:hypothetical protein
MKALLATTAFAISFTAAALAQDAAPSAPPPVESMNCEQMQAELMVAGQTMNAQMDPEFATEAQAMQDEMQEAQNRAAGSVAAGIGMGLACSIPGVGMACMAAQQAQMANAQRDAAANQARMDAQMDRLNQSMAGLDQQRLTAISQRFEEQRCQTPQ